jgi:lysophospholipase L1-like esterase
MKKKMMVSVLLCALSIGLWAVGCNAPDVTKPCVVMLGDSIFALSDEEGRVLFELAGDTYREYYISGAQMVGGPIKTIKEQYDDAKAEGPIRTVILDGGGNDILIGANAKCSVDYGTELSAECVAVMDEVLAAAEEFFEISVADGVKNIVFQGYYYVRNQKLWQVTDVFQEKGIRLVQELSARYPDVKIMYIDPRPHFDRTNQDYLIVDGIHPTDAASAKLANLLWNAMVARGIEQNSPCPGDGGGCN